MNNTILDEIVSDIQNKNFDSAISKCSELISKYPDNYNLFEIRARCYTATGSFDFAIADLTNALNKTVNSAVSKSDILKLFLKRGKTYIRKQEWEFASNDFIEVLRIDNDLPDVHNSLSLCYKKLGKYNDALFHSSKAISLKEDFAEAYNNRANINICLDKYEDAISDYSRSISINPNNPKGYFNRGSIYYEVFKDKNKCFGDFITAIKLNPSYENEIYNFYPELRGNLTEQEAEDLNINEVSKNETEQDIDSLLTKINNSEISAENQSVKPSDDIVVPDIDFKSVFSGVNNEEDAQIIEEKNQSILNPEISEDVKILHNEISNVNPASNPDDRGEIKGFNVAMNTEDNEITGKPLISTNQQPSESGKSFLRTPVFFLILIGLMIIIIVLSVLKFYKSKENVIVTNDVITKVDSTDQENKDTIKEVTKSDTMNNTAKEETAVTETEKKTEANNNDKKEDVKAPLESKNLGYISDKKQYVLFSEPDGYYVQIGSYKEKSKAEEKLKFLKSKNIKAVVVEADLKDKGIFYRVRAGVYKTPEEAKEITGKVE